MIGRIPYPLSMHREMGKPAVKDGVTWEAYLEALGRIATDTKAKACIVGFRRWCRAKGLTGQQAVFDETLLESLADDLNTGKLHTDRNRPYKKTLARQLPTLLRTMHNRVFAQDCGGICSRELLPRLAARRMIRFLQLTPQTQAALEWFESFGSAPAKKNGKAMRPLTTATRKHATYGALYLLDQLKKKGLEEIRTADLPELSPDAPGYRSQCRMRHTAAAVFRCCVAKGLLSDNPLVGASNETFHGLARRDFVSPDQLTKLLDLDTVDRSNARQVMDRLVMLMYLDLGLRKCELAAVRLDGVRQIAPRKFQVMVEGVAQKMGDKPTVVVDVLYGQTAGLLPVFLRQRGSKPGSLFLNTKGNPASGDVLATCVKREAERIEIKSYFGKVPTCHSLRRTLATVNADRLGMQLNPHEIAQRLRCSIDVAFRHYVQDNPLLRSIKADQQRKLLAGDPHHEAQTHLEALQKLGVSGDSLAAARAEIENKLAPKPVPVNATWTAEDDALKQLRERWELEINHRFMRRHFQSVGALDHKGEHRRARYRDDVLAELLARDPIETYLAARASRRQREAVIAQFDTLRIGQLALVRRDDSPRIMRFLKSRFAPDYIDRKSKVA